MRLLDRRFILLLLILALFLIRGLTYSAIIPPWQAPDEPSHYEYGRRLGEVMRWLTRADISVDLQREVLASMYRFDFWRYLGHQMPESPPQSMRQVPSLAASRTQLGDETPVGYVLYAFVYRLLRRGGLLTQLYAMRWVSILLSGLVVLLGFLTAEEFLPEDRFVVWGVPIFIAFVPTFAFIGGAVNNDNMAALLSAGAFFTAVRIYRRGLAAGRVVALILLATAAILAKKTALFLLPLILLGGLIYLLDSKRLSLEDERRWVLVPVLLLLPLAWLAFTWPGGDATGWVEFNDEWGDTRSAVFVREGSYAIHVHDNATDEWEYAAQFLPRETVERLQGETLKLQAWVRSGKDEGAGHIILSDNKGGWKAHVFTATTEWQRVSVSMGVSPGAQVVRVALVPGKGRIEGTGDLYFDEVTLSRATADGIDSGSFLRNGSGEEGDKWWKGKARAVVEYLALRDVQMGWQEGRFWADAAGPLYPLFMVQLFRSFWGVFGWVTVEVSSLMYWVWGGLSLAAIGGLAALAVHRGVSLEWLSAWRKRVLLLCGLALVLSVAVVVLAYIPRLSSRSYPQGRYLFPVVVPIALLFTVGLRALVPQRYQVQSLVLLLAFLFLLDSAAFLLYVIPFFHGG